MSDSLSGFPKPNIMQLITEYLATFPEERDRIRQLSELVEHSNSPKDLISPTNFVGHITASGLVLDPSGTKGLLVYHKSLRKYLQPGGHFECNGESPLEVALREIHEETRISSIVHLPFHLNPEVPFDIDTHPIPENRRKNEPDHWHHDFRYLFVCQEHTDVTLDENESTDYQWVEIKELLRMPTFTVLAPKIHRALSREFRPQKFFADLIRMIDLKEHVSTIVVTHAVPDVVVYLNALAKVSEIRAVIPKPKSLVPEILASLKGHFSIAQMTREQIRSDNAIDEFLASARGKVVLFDIGGYFAPVVQSLTQRFPGKIIGVIEDTENGHQKYETVFSLPVPVYSVARSPLKANEDFLVGQSIVFSADAILRECGKLIQYLNCSVFGFGKVGNSITHHLLLRGVKPNAFDINPIRRLDALNRLSRTPTKEHILRNSDVLFCATGNHVLDILDFRQLKPGCFVFSVTSSDDEMDLRYLESEYSTEDVSEHVTKYSNVNNHFFLVNKGNAVNFIHKSGLGNFIHLVQGEMIYALKLLLSSDSQPGIYEIPEQARKQVAEIWLSTFLDEQGAL